MSKEGVLSVNTSGGAVIETLSSEGGPHTPPDGHNFNFSGSIAGGSAANGAIKFITPGGPGAATNGQMDAEVLVDNVTIEINPSNELQVIAGLFAETITGDTGGPLSPTLGNWNIISNVAANNSGATVSFDGSGSTLTLNVSDANVNTYVGDRAGVSGPGTSASTALGTLALNMNSSGASNTAIGANALRLATATSNSTAIGTSSLGQLLTGVGNTALGTSSGNSYTTNESNNILISNIGTIGDANTIRIGQQGSGLQQQNLCFIAGITGVTTSNSNIVTIDTTTGQLGATATAGLSTIDGDTGSATGATISFLATPTAGSSVSFDASGSTVAFNVTDANSNTIIGLSAGNGGISGTGNTGIGKLVFSGLGAGINSTAIGYSALAGLGGNEGCTAVGYKAIQAMFGQRNTGIGEFSLGSASGASGSFNSCLGYNTGVNLTSGSENLILGTAGTVGSGSQYTSSESSNILLNHAGVTGESNVMRLGTNGSGGGQVNSTFIAGVVGVTVSNQQAVVINSSTGQLGVGSGSFSAAYTDVTFGMSPYTVLATDQYISCNTSGGAITLNFPNAPTANQTWIVKDRTGNSAANNVTITTPGGTVTFDGATTLLLNTAYAAVNLLANATPTYEVY